MLAGIVIDAGTGAALEFELVKAMLVGVGGAAVSCSCSHGVSPLGCGFGEADHVRVIGSVSVTPSGGDNRVSAGGTGLLKKTEKEMTFDGALKMPFAFTARTRAK